MESDDENEKGDNMSTYINNISMSQNNNIQSTQKRKKNLPSIFKTMALGIMSLIGERITIELRNNQIIYGILEECDTNMNIILSNVVTNNINKKDIDIKSDILHVNGTTIRYIHVDNKINVLGQVVKYTKNIDKINNKSFKIYDKKKNVGVGVGSGISNSGNSTVTNVGSKRANDELESLERNEFVITSKVRKLEYEEA